MSDAGELAPIEKASVDELRKLQLERLRSTLEHTYKNVATFRSKCETAGIEPGDLKSLEDLSKFPFTVKDDLRQNYPFGMFAVPQNQVVRVHASSGTTGKPTVVGYTRNDIDMWADVMARSIRAAGGKPGDKIHNAYGYGLFTGGLGAHYGAERLGAMVIPMSGGQTPKQVQLIRDFEADIIMATPSYMLNIADEFERQGVDPASSSLRIGIFGAEPWGESMRTEIETRCGIDAIDIYGLSEVIGPGVACESIETKDGPTIWEDHFYPEVVDPQTGEPLPDGTEGELVFTSLTKIRGVNVFPTQIEEQVLKQDELAPHYQIRISRSGKLDQLTVQVERKPEVDKTNTEKIANALKKDIKDYIGVSTSIEVCDPGQVARSEGKAVRVIDERK
jgi:phenylacetate-CoA ligase